MEPFCFPRAMAEMAESGRERYQDSAECSEQGLSVIRRGVESLGHRKTASAARQANSEALTLLSAAAAQKSASLLPFS